MGTLLFLDALWVRKVCNSGLFFFPFASSFSHEFPKRRVKCARAPLFHAHEARALDSFVRACALQVAMTHGRADPPTTMGYLGFKTAWIEGRRKRKFRLLLLLPLFVLFCFRNFPRLEHWKIGRKLSFALCRKASFVASRTKKPWHNLGQRNTLFINDLLLT